MPEANSIDVVVTVSDQHVHKLDELARHLQAQGLQIDRTLRELGMITGTVASDKLQGLARIEGVNAVEPAGQAGVPPPQDDLQ